MRIEEAIYKELQSIKEPLGVLSTVNEFGFPQSACVYYICDAGLNIFFVVRSGSRKYKNVSKNPHASFVITSMHPPKTFQLEGVVTEVTTPHEQTEYFTTLVGHATDNTPMPPVSQMVSGEMVFMKLSTTWARMGNFEVMKEGDKFVEISLTQIS